MSAISCVATLSRVFADDLIQLICAKCSSKVLPADKSQSYCSKCGRAVQTKLSCRMRALVTDAVTHTVHHVFLNDAALLPILGAPIETFLQFIPDQCALHRSIADILNQFLNQTMLLEFRPIASLSKSVRPVTLMDVSQHAQSLNHGRSLLFPVRARFVSGLTVFEAILPKTPKLDQSNSMATSMPKASPWVQLNQSGLGVELVVCSQSPLSSQNSLFSHSQSDAVFIPESPWFQSPSKPASSRNFAIENEPRQVKHYREGADLVSPLLSCKPPVKRSKVFSFASPETKQTADPLSIQRHLLTPSSSSSVKAERPVDTEVLPSPSAVMKREIEATLDLLRDQKFFEDFFSVS